MSKSNSIQIFLRVKPTTKPDKNISRCVQLEINQEQNLVQFNLCDKKNTDYVNNNPLNKEFKFNQVLNMATGQKRVFDTVAKDVCDSAVQGYNGTVFAYGQTGSGKTFTITGGAERHQDRGIIPRCLTYLYNIKASRTDLNMRFQICYLQIYENKGYDLLDKMHTQAKSLQQLTKVIPFQSQNQGIRLRGLTQHSPLNQQDALNLLFVGDTNRVVAQTPKNDASTRSHCIFMIKVMTNRVGDGVQQQGTINLVDLSGSQRIDQTGIEGKQRKQAININMSLFMLTRVIECLNEKASNPKVFVPYRDSLMTLVLKDSIGGNCKTRMVATITNQFEDTQESISTCRFAQRVACIKNQLKRNHKINPQELVIRLKLENKRLKQQIQLLKGSEKNQLYPQEIQQLHRNVDDFINSTNPQEELFYNDRLKINQCFYYFRQVLKNQSGNPKMQNNPAVLKNNFMNDEKEQKQGKGVKNQQFLDEIKKLKILVQQRDNEILVLCNLLNKNKDQQNFVKLSQQPANNQLMKSVIRQEKPITFQNTLTESKNDVSITQSKYIDNRDRLEKQVNQAKKMLVNPINFTQEQLKDRVACFEAFRKQYRKNEAMKQNQMVLKKKHEQGKRIGLKINEARSRMNQLKQQLQRLKKTMVLQQLQKNEESHNPKYKAIEQQIINLRKQQDVLISIGKSMPEIKEIRSQIIEIQAYMERNFKKMQADFDKYIKVMEEQKKKIIPSDNASTYSSQNKSYIRDPKVHENLKKFYEARDELYKE